MSKALITLQNASLSFGTKTLFENLSHVCGQGQKTVLVGRNGSGKSSLLKVLAGDLPLDSGHIIRQNGQRLSTLKQFYVPEPHETTLSYISEGLGPYADETWRAQEIMTELNIPYDANLATLSGGELRRASLARALVGEPDLLLMDEPTNHLDIPTIEWLEKRLKAFKGSFILISHDRTFLRNTVDTCLWLHMGEIFKLTKGFEHFEDWSQKIEEEIATTRHKRDRFLKEEGRWAVEGISARRKRNMGRLRRLQDMRKTRANEIKNLGDARMELETSGKSGKIVLEAEHISKSFERPIFTDFSARVKRGDRVGLIGPNGAGKTTLLKTLLGELEPDEGTVTLGTNLDILFIDQKRDELSPEMTVREFLTGGSSNQVDQRGTPRHAAGYIKDFLFDGEQLLSPIKSLSGGEQNRLLLAKAFLKPANLVVLDEPTNDLDMETLDLLEDLLADFEGTVLLVSHDRDFIDRLVTQTYVFDGAGQIEEHAGGYSDYLNRIHSQTFQNKTPEPSARSMGLQGNPGNKQKKALSTIHLSKGSRDPGAAGSINKNNPKSEGLRQGRPAAAESSAPQRSRSGASGVSSNKRLSYKHKRALEILPDQIDTVTKEIKTLEEKLADPNLYAQNPDDFNRITKALDQKQTDQSNLEEELFEAELAREEVG